MGSKGITVKAIAGEVRRVTYTPWGSSEPASTGGDLVVPVQSATAEYTTTGNGDGKTVFACDDPIALTNVSHPWCEHNGMLKSPKVQTEVKSSIQAYLASIKPARATKLPLPAHHTVDDFFTDLKLPYLHTWIGAMSEHNVVMNVVDNTNCNNVTAACPHIYFHNLNEAQNREVAADPVAAIPKSYGSCSSTGAPTTIPLKRIATRYIGGIAADYYEEVCGQLRFYAWHVKNRHFLVAASDTPAGKINLPGLRASLDNVKWVSARHA
jgi:hypothetical protein